MSRDAAAAIRALRRENPDLAGKVQLGAELPAQLPLFSDGSASRQSAGKKAHDWDRDRPILKTKLSTLLYCKQCKCQMRLQEGGAVTYGVSVLTVGRSGRVMMFSTKRPDCVPPKEAEHG